MEWWTPVWRRKEVWIRRWLGDWIWDKIRYIDRFYFWVMCDVLKRK